MRKRHVVELTTASFRTLCRQFRIPLTALALLVAGGTAGYAGVEGWPLFDALYMTVITVTTVGYREIHPLSRSGEIFTMLLVTGGVGLLFYVMGNITRVVLEGELAAVFGRRRAEKKMITLKNHYIVCGYGRMGRIVARDFASREAPFVVVERDLGLVQGADPGHLLLHGDASQDAVLLKAGIERARGLVAVVSSDADNLYITMTARLLRADINIVARASDEAAEQKLLRAGANRVVAPYVIGGTRVAHAVLKPAVVDFLELATRTGNLELQIEEIPLNAGSLLEGKTIRDAGLAHEHGVIVVAVKKGDGKMEFNPPVTRHLAEGDTLIVLGPPEKLRAVERAAQRQT